MPCPNPKIQCLPGSGGVSQAQNPGSSSDEPLVPVNQGQGQGAGDGTGPTATPLGTDQPATATSPASGLTAVSETAVPTDVPTITFEISDFPVDAAQDQAFVIDITAPGIFGGNASQSSSSTLPQPTSGLAIQNTGTGQGTSQPAAQDTSQDTTQPEAQNAAQNPAPIDALRRRDGTERITVTPYSSGSFVGANGDHLYAVAADESERADIFRFLQGAVASASAKGSARGDYGNTFFNYTGLGYTFWARSYPPWTTGAEAFNWREVFFILQVCLFFLRNGHLTAYFAGTVSAEGSSTSQVDFAFGPAFQFAAVDPDSPPADFDVSQGPSRKLLSLLNLGSSGLTAHVEAGFLSTAAYLIYRAARLAASQWAACDSNLLSDDITIGKSHRSTVPFDFHPLGNAHFTHQEIELLLGSLVQYVTENQYMRGGNLPVLRGVLLRGGVQVAAFVLGALIDQEFSSKNVVVVNPDDSVGYGTMVFEGL